MSKNELFEKLSTWTKELSRQLHAFPAVMPRVARLLADLSVLCTEIEAAGNQGEIGLICDQITKHLDAFHRSDPSVRALVRLDKRIVDQLVTPRTSRGTVWKSSLNKEMKFAGDRKGASYVIPNRMQIQTIVQGAHELVRELSKFDIASQTWHSETMTGKSEGGDMPATFQDAGKGEAVALAKAISANEVVALSAMAGGGQADTNPHLYASWIESANRVTADWLDGTLDNLEASRLATRLQQIGAGCGDIFATELEQAEALSLPQWTTLQADSEKAYKSLLLLISAIAVDSTIGGDSVEATDGRRLECLMRARALLFAKPVDHPTNE